MEKSYITLMHEFAVSRANSGFTDKELLNYLAAHGVNIKDKDLQAQISRTRDGMVFGGAKKGESYYYIRDEAHYRHMDYLEMKAAQQNAKDARKWSLIALIVSGILAALQVIFAAIPVIWC